MEYFIKDTSENKAKWRADKDGNPTNYSPKYHAFIDCRILRSRINGHKILTIDSKDPLLKIMQRCACCDAAEVPNA